MTREDALRVLAVIQAGELMSNLVWNLAHNCRPGDLVTVSTIKRARETSEWWDKAQMEAKAAYTAMKKLPAAFDPIELGA